jgi:hypothetical protein
MANRYLEAATDYLKRGLNIIPMAFIREDSSKGRKQPLVSWTAYQKQKVSEAELIQWWGKNPKAMLGCVCGKISDLCTVDIDSPEGHEQIQTYIPDSLEVPTYKTQSGGYQMCFKAPQEYVGPIVRCLPGVDFRGEKSIAILPPSETGYGGSYKWQDGPSLSQRPPLPDSMLLYIINKYLYIEHDEKMTNGNADDSIFASQGNRDNTLFHVANIMARGGGRTDEISQVLNILAKSCSPPFSEKEIEVKVQSAMERAIRRDKSLAQDVREWVLSSKGVISSSDFVKLRHVSSLEEHKNLSKIFSRLIEEGLIERYGNKNGVFRRIERDFEVMDFKRAETDEFKINWPLEIEGLCRVYPGNIIIVAGSKSAGKTAFLLNVIKENMNQHEIIYLNSEMGESELKVRLQLFEDVPLDSWVFTPVIRHDAWADLITDHKKIWIIDYLEMPSDRLHMVADEIRAIHSKLKDGICIIGLQKVSGRDTGRGDSFTLDKARLYLSLDHGRIKIVDAKAWRDGRNNPRGKIRHFKLVNGSRFIPEGFWKDE